MSEPDTEPEQIFEGLLASWYEQAVQIQGEWGVTPMGESDGIDEARDEWRERFRIAMKTVGSL